MEVGITEVSFHQSQTVYLETIFSPVLAAASYLVHELLTIHNISNLLLYYNSK
jgi:hypothetical protein